jgi:hypothetical protein
LRNLRALRPSLEVHAFRVRREQQVVTDALEVVPGQELDAKYDVKVHASSTPLGAATGRGVRDQSFQPARGRDAARALRRR